VDALLSRKTRAVYATQWLRDAVAIQVDDPSSDAVEEWLAAQTIPMSANAIESISARVSSLYLDGRVGHPGFHQSVRRIDKIRNTISSRVASPYDAEPHASIDSDVVTATLGLLTMHDEPTSTHSRAVGRLARRISNALGMDETEASFVEVCGTLHDIGKVSIPVSIIGKPDKLTPEEWATMDNAPQAGAEYTIKVPSLRRCSGVILCIQERWDGTGYPNKLSGKNIPLAARIVAVADAFDAMTRKRPYATAMMPREAMAVLEDGAGGQWDPVVIACFLETFGSTRVSKDAAQSLGSVAV